MSTKSYVVKLIAGDSDSTRVWNTRKPLAVGHPTRWNLEATETGVQIRAVSGGRARLLKNADLEMSTGVELSEGFQIELMPVQAVASAATDLTATGPALRIFHQKGEWTVDTSILTSKYVATFEGRKIFSLQGSASGIYSSADRIALKPLIDGLLVNDLPLPRGETRQLSLEEARVLVIRFEGSEWRLAPFEPSHEEFAALQGMDSEQRLFAKVLKITAAAILFLFALSFMLAPSLEDKKEEKIAILLTPPKKIVKGLMTAAPKGADDAKDFSIGQKGSEKNAGRKGGSSTVAKAKPKKSAPAKEASSRVVEKRTGKEGAAKTVAQNRNLPMKSVPMAPKSALFKTFNSSAFKRASQSLVSNGMGQGISGAGDSAAEARSMMNSRGSKTGSLDGSSGISTRSASVSGFGSGGDGDGGPGSAGAGYGRGSYSKVSGQGRSMVSLDTGASDVDEGLTRDQVGRVIHAHMNEIRYCYEAAVLRESSLEGKMHMQFSIGAVGTVGRAGVGSSTVNNRRLHECVVARLRTWQFPKPKGGVTVAVNYPLMFKTLTR